jgi:glycosyltransferase involved in cell wall biosynthesis
LRELEIDIVYTKSVKAHFLAGIAAKSLGLPAVSHLRDILTGNARLLLRSIVLATTVHRVAISRAVARAYAMPDTTIILNPIDLSEYEDIASREVARARLNLPQDVPIVGVIGRINRWKRQDLFLHVARLVADKTPAHFAIVGAAVFRDASFVEELKTLALKLGIADRVHFIPWLADPRDAFASLDIHANTSEREPFGRTIIEAAAIGVPTISFDDGGAEDAVSPSLAHDIVRSGDTEAFAAAILRYLDDPELLAQAGREAIAFSRTFDASKHAQSVCALLHDVVPQMKR